MGEERAAAKAAAAWAAAAWVVTAAEPPLDYSLGGSTGWHSGRTWAGDGVGMRLTAESGRPDMGSKHERFDVRRSTTALRRRRARHELRRALEQPHLARSGGGTGWPRPAVVRMWARSHLQPPASRDTAPRRSITGMCQPLACRKRMHVHCVHMACATTVVPVVR